MRLSQAVGLEKCYEVEQKKGSKVDAVAFPVDGACDDSRYHSQRMGLRHRSNLNEFSIGLFVNRAPYYQGVTL